MIYKPFISPTSGTCLHGEKPNITIKGVTELQGLLGLYQKSLGLSKYDIKYSLYLYGLYSKLLGFLLAMLISLVFVKPQIPFTRVCP